VNRTWIINGLTRLNLDNLILLKKFSQYSYIYDCFSPSLKITTKTKSGQLSANKKTHRVQGGFLMQTGAFEKLYLPATPDLSKDFTLIVHFKAGALLAQDQYLCLFNFALAEGFYVKLNNGVLYTKMYANGIHNTNSIPLSINENRLVIVKNSNTSQIYLNGASIGSMNSSAFSGYASTNEIKLYPNRSAISDRVFIQHALTTQEALRISKKTAPLYEPPQQKGIINLPDLTWSRRTDFVLNINKQTNFSVNL